jgi:tetratricopeptide (TPR) repeat protein
MRRNSYNRLVLAVLVFATATWIGCDKTNSEGTSAAPAGGGKIPITTKSEEARKEFLLGRDLSEKLQAQESIEHFQKAVAIDPEFASAELALANSAPTAKDFFDHLNKAVALADKTSEGERILILANQAGSNGEVVKQKEYFEKLVSMFPNDERAHFNLGAFEFAQQDSPRHRAFEEGARTGTKLFSGLQHAGLRIPAGGRLQQCRTGVQEIH